MNYIKHLNNIFQAFAKDSRLNATHISLYMALFQYWNLNRFPELFFINREEIMQLSKIGSKATYHRCLKNMDDWNYIKYLPSHNPFKGSKIKMLIFSATSEQDLAKLETSSEQALVSNTNYNKQEENSSKCKLPKTEIEVVDFFKSKKWPALEGLKFFNHYQAIGWKLGGKIKITDWHATASNWMLKSKELQQEKQLSLNKDNLKTSIEKNYGEPL